MPIHCGFYPQQNERKTNLSNNMKYFFLLFPLYILILNVNISFVFRSCCCWHCDESKCLIWGRQKKKRENRTIHIFLSIVIISQLSRININIHILWICSYRPNNNMIIFRFDISTKKKKKINFSTSSLCVWGSENLFILFFLLFLKNIISTKWP